MICLDRFLNGLLLFDPLLSGLRLGGFDGELELGKLLDALERKGAKSGKTAAVAGALGQPMMLVRVLFEDSTLLQNGNLITIPFSVSFQAGLSDEKTRAAHPHGCRVQWAARLLEGLVARDVKRWLDATHSQPTLPFGSSTWRTATAWDGVVAKAVLVECPIVLWSKHRVKG